MKRYCFLVLTILVLTVSRAYPQPESSLPVITPAGKGKVNTKIDNMGYWNRMVESGYVLPNPVVTVPEARFTGQSLHPWIAPDPVRIPYSRTSALRHFTLLTPQNSPDVPVTEETDVTQHENSVFIDPADEDLVLNSNNSTNWKLGAAQELWGADGLWSYDGGLSWDGSSRGVGETNNGDPSVAIGTNGWWYVGRINNKNGQSVSYSQDQGKTWTTTEVASVPWSGVALLDKNHLWIDNAPGSPYNGYLYDAWTNFVPGSPDTNQVMLSRSGSQGQAWSVPVNLSASAGALQLNHGVNIHTGPGGEVYVAWSIYDAWPADENAIGFTSSQDGGASFAPASRIISNIKGIRTSLTGKNMRVNSFPSMAVDISTGPNRGNIYIVWANYGVPGVNTGNDIDIYLIRSTDAGSTWSVPIRVNQDPAGLGKQHYFPWITCDPVTGGLCVIYYDDRNLPSNQAAVFVSWSYDGGLTWEDVQVSDYTFTPSPVPGLAYDYFGDYLGIQSRNMKVFPVWTDNHENGRAMTYTSPFFLGPNPGQPWITYYSSALSPVNGTGNGLMNNGDSLHMTLDLKNVGDQPAQNITAVLSCSNPYIMITDSTENYGMIDSAEVKSIPNGFAFRVSDTIPDNLLVRFRIRAFNTDSVWYSQFSLEAHAPALSIGGLTVIDTIQGNHNGRLDRGETVRLVIPITNTGDHSCTPTAAELSTSCPFLTFVNSSVAFDSIPPGQTRDAIFTAIVDQNTPSGTGADLEFITYSGAYSWQRSFRKVIGMIIEDWETGDFSRFPWHSEGTLPWIVTNINPFEGVYCARSGAIPDYTTSKLFVNYPSSVADSISFNLWTSTEEGCDWLNFYIDGVKQDQWSGEVPWTRAAFPVSAGMHEYRWVYQKDLSFFYGEDRAMIDFIVFPPPVLPSVNVGLPDTICAGLKASLKGYIQECDSVKWTTTGDGVFGNDTTAFTTYMPGPGDISAGQATCRLTGFGLYGNTARDKLILIKPRPEISISISPKDTVCAGQQITLSADTTGITNYLWMPGNVNTREAIYDTALAGGLGTRLVTLLVTSNLGCPNADSVYLTFKDCTGIVEYPGTGFRIYPNPGNGHFTIETNRMDDLEIMVKNESGAEVFRDNLPGNRNKSQIEVNLSFLPDGVYLLLLKTSRGSVNSKLVIRK